MTRLGDSGERTICQCGHVTVGTKCLVCSGRIDEKTARMREAVLTKYAEMRREVNHAD